MEKLPAKFSPSRWVGGAASLVFLVGGIANLGIGTIRAWQGDAAAAAACLGAALLMLFGANIDRFEFVKGLGIEAKTRELKQTISAGQDLADQLREVAELSARNMISMHAMQGRWNSVPDAKSRHGVAMQTKDLLQSLGFPASVVREVMKPWERTTAFDLAIALRRRIGHDLESLQSTVKGERNALFDDTAPGTQAAIYRMQRLAEFRAALMERAGTHDESPMIQAERLRALAIEAQQIDPRAGQIVVALTESWLPRLEHLSSTGTLDDTTLWLKALGNEGS